MLDNSSREIKVRFILTKAYEVSYAIFRIASQITENDFSEQLRVCGTALLTATAGEHYTSAEESIRVMECLIKFAGDMNIISTAHSDVLLREIYALNAAIAELKNIPKTDGINIAGIFSKPEVAVHREVVDVKKEEEEQQPVIIHSATERPVAHEPYQSTESHEVHESAPQNINTILKSAIRQTAIIDRIRQSGNCRMKDILEILPDASERTIRYDLQTLLEQNQIERVGIAGPSVYYRAKQIA